MDSNDTSEEVTTALRQYEWLRDEINQSNRLQNRVIFAQAILVGLGVGLKSAEVLGDTGNISSTLSLGLFFLPVLVITSTGVWLLEQARVMRAGNYLHHLEYYINQQLETNPVAWESWLRGEWEPPNIESGAPRIQRIRGRLASPQHVYNWAFLIGYPAYFLTLTFVSMVLVYQLRAVIPGGVITVGIYGAVTMSASLALSAASFLQINHGTHDRTDSLSDYHLFLRDVFDKEPHTMQMNHLFRLYESELNDIPLETNTVHEQFQEIIALAKEGEQNEH